MQQPKFQIKGSDPAMPNYTEWSNNKYWGFSMRQQLAKDFMTAMLASPELLQVVTAEEVIDASFAGKVAKKAFDWAEAFIQEANKHDTELPHDAYGSRK